MTEINVFARRPRPTSKSYREAIAEIMRRIGGGMTDCDLAERLGCSVGTVRNARNEKGNLDGVTLIAIAHEFGPPALDPLMKLAGGRAVPLTSLPANDLNLAACMSHAAGELVEAVADGIRCHVETIAIAEKMRPIVPQMTAIIHDADRIRAGQVG